MRLRKGWKRAAGSGGEGGYGWLQDEANDLSRGLSSGEEGEEREGLLMVGIKYF